jgi:hypothetical protein
MQKSIDRVQQVNIQEGWSGTPEESGEAEIEISDQQETTPAEIMGDQGTVDDYPLGDQTVITGSFDYEQTTRLGTKQATGSFQIRTGSSLFIIRQETGQADFASITKALDQRLDGSLEVHEKLLPSREGLWKFIDSAHSRLELEVLMPYGQVKTLSEVQEEDNLSYANLMGQYPVEKATLIFRTGDERRTEVRYQQNSLSISADDYKDYESVIEMFERDVIMS